MKQIFTLLFTLIIISYVNGDYSINQLIEYLENTGIYNIIAEVNSNYGNDVAIELCMQIVQSYNCQDVVRVYIGPPSPRPQPAPGGPPIVIPSIREILTSTDNFLILVANMNFNDLMELINSY